MVVSDVHLGMKSMTGTGIMASILVDCPKKVLVVSDTKGIVIHRMDTDPSVQETEAEKEYEGMPDPDKKVFIDEVAQKELFNLFKKLPKTARFVLIKTDEDGEPVAIHISGAKVALSYGKEDDPKASSKEKYPNYENILKQFTDADNPEYMDKFNLSLLANILEAIPEGGAAHLSFFGKGRPMKIESVYKGEIITTAVLMPMS